MKLEANYVTQFSVRILSEIQFENDHAWTTLEEDYVAHDDRPYKFASCHKQVFKFYCKKTDS